MLFFSVDKSDCALLRNSLLAAIARFLMCWPLYSIFHILRFYLLIVSFVLISPFTFTHTAQSSSVRYEEDWLHRVRWVHIGEFLCHYYLKLFRWWAGCNVNQTYLEKSPWPTLSQWVTSRTSSFETQNRNATHSHVWLHLYLKHWSRVLPLCVEEQPMIRYILYSTCTMFPMITQVRHHPVDIII